MEEFKKKESRRTVLFITTLSSFLTTFMSSSINIALPSIGHEYSINALRLSWISMAYLLTASIFLIPFGRIADIYGRKKYYTIGIFIYGFSSLLITFAPTSIILIILRAIQGTGGALIFGTAIAILTSAFPINERGKVLGINLAATYFGLSSGPFFGGILTHQLGWRSVFYATTLLSIVIIPFIFLKLKSEWAEAKNEKFDYKGSLVYMAGLFLFMYGFSKVQTIVGIISLGSGIMILVLFFRIEKHIGSPVLDLSHFRNNKVFIFSNIAAFINYSATAGVGFLLSLYLQYIKGLNPQAAGLIMVSQPIAMALFSPLAGRLSDKIEPRIVASTGMALTAAGLFLLIFIGSDTAMLYIIATLIIIGIGFALFASPNTNAIMSSVERKHYGTASASVGTMRLTGQTISISIAMILFALIIGKGKITPEYYPEFLICTRTAFIIFTILCTVGVFASLSRGKLR